MIIDSTAKISMSLGGAVAANQSKCVVSYVDMDATTFTPGFQIATTSGAADVDILAAPSASHQRKVTSLFLVNADTAAITVTFEYDLSGTDTTLYVCTLGVGEKVQYIDGSGWCVFDASGAPKAVTSGTGVWLGTFVKTSGTTYVTGLRTTSIFVRLMAGGGAGGGCTSVAAAASAAGGGGAGGYAEKTFVVTPNTTYTIQVGAAGAGVSGAGGGNGTDSTFAVGATTVTAKAGQGAVVATALTTLSAYLGGAGGTVSTNGDVNGAGMPGEYGVSLVIATPVVASGSGGSGPFGAGGQGRTTVGNGNNAAGFGAGGGGAATGASTVRTGGNGAAGVIIVDEYA